MNRRQAIQTAVAACVGACLPGAAAAGEVQTVILTGTQVYLPGPDDYVEWKNYSFTYSNDVLTVVKANKTIDFGTLASKQVGDAPFALTGAASSGEAVTYVSSDPSKASVSGNIATPVAVGSTNITASSVVVIVHYF